MNLNTSTAPIIADSNGFRFRLEPCLEPYRQSLCNRASDEAQRLATSALLGDARMVFDVGAHAGRFSVFVERLAGFDGTIHAFEPVPSTISSLTENLKLNLAKRVTIHPVAVSDCDGFVNVHLFPKQFSSWNSLGRPTMTAPDGRRVQPNEIARVRSLTLDSFCESHNIDRIDFLKVDVEGFESAVFRGGSRVLSSGSVGYVCFEISRDPLLGAGIAARDAFDILASYGYSAWRFNPSLLRFEGPIIDSQEHWNDYYASRAPLNRIDVLMALAERRAKQATPSAA